jgi:protein-disulfide isomerase
VRRDFQGGVRGGVTATPVAFAGDRVITADVEAELARLA